MAIIDVNDFTREAECVYKNERYSARDNGAVLRHQKPGKRVRNNDNLWTFGKVNISNSYLYLSDARIHRIVATAFHGQPLDLQYVVDHIDTNRRNNRPENLRWLTRLENALLNPITRKKIEYLCGSIEMFLENPSILSAIKVEKNFEWMRTVTSEEAQNCKERMLHWASTSNNSKGGSLGGWVYEPIKYREVFSKIPAHKLEALANEEAQNGKARMALCLSTDNKPRGASFDDADYEPIKDEGIFGVESELVMALTKNCAQYMWRVPSYFPCCPEEIGTNPIDEYFQNLKVGSVFSFNDIYPESTIIDFVRIENNSAILVMCQRDGLKPWSIAKIIFVDGVFVHSSLGSFFIKDGADKTFCIKQGLEWGGGDTFDDFC